MASVPRHGPFHERPSVDFVGASVVLLLNAALAAISFIALAAFFTKALGQ